jgi:hydroxymethylbilane synthase
VNPPHHTRLRRIHEAGGCDAVVLAAAGLNRLKRASEIAERFDPVQWLPAPGQGALAVMVRENDEETQALTAPLNDPKTNAAVSLERNFLAALGGGCSEPAGAYARVEAHSLVLTAMLGDPERGQVYRGEVRGPASAAVSFINTLVKDICPRSGRALPEGACQRS